MALVTYYGYKRIILIIFILCINTYIFFITYVNDSFDNNWNKQFSTKSLNIFRKRQLNNTTNNLSNEIAMNIKDNHSSKPIEITIKYSTTITSDNLFWVNGMYEYYLKDTLKIVNVIQINETQTLREVILSNGKRDLTYIQGHEFCKEPLNMDLNKHSTLIAYNYWDDNRDKKYWNKISNRLKPKPIYMPLFFRPDFGNFQSDIYSLIYNQSNILSYNKRYYLMSVMISMHTEYRNKYKYIWDNIENNAKYRHKYKIYTHFTKGWQELNTKGAYLNKTQYKNKLLNSKFEHVPPGNNPETYRLWETLACSSIPIIAIETWDYLNHQCKNAYNGFLFYNKTNNKINNDLIFDYVNQFWGIANVNKYHKWYFLDSKSEYSMYHLNNLYKTNRFIPIIFLRGEMDLEPFLNFVIEQEHKNKTQSDEFWNTFQYYSNQWLKDIITFKMNQFKDAVLNGFQQ
eukprot:87504_1